MGMGPDQIQALLAPYMQAQASQGSPSQVAGQFGGLGQLGMQLLANNTPSPVKQPLGALLGKSMLAAQDATLQQAKARQELASNAIAMQNQMSLLAALSGQNGGGQGTGLPIDAPDSGSAPADPSQPQQASAPGASLPSPGGAPAAAPNAPPAAPLPPAAGIPTSQNGLSPAAVQRLLALAKSSAAPPGAQVPAAPPGASPAPQIAPSAAPPGAPGGLSPGGLPAGQPQGSAAPPGASVQRQQIMPPGGSGQLPPNFPAFNRVSAPPAAPGAPGSAPAVPTSLPKWFNPPSAAQIANVPIGGVNTQLLQRLALMRGQDPVALASKINEQQRAVAKQEYGAPIAQLDTLVKSDAPTKYVKADPSLQAAWQQLAPQLGMDPQKDFTDQNVRTAFSFERNRLAGAVGAETTAPNVMLKTSPNGVGGTVQTDPVTGKQSTGIPQQETDSFVKPDGSVVLMTKAEGMRQGLPPFNSETYINPASVGNTASMIASYKLAPLNGQAMRSAQGQAIMAQVRTLNPDYDSTQFPVKQAAREAFATGTQGNTVRSLSVATDHLNQLGAAATALSQNNLPAVNAAVNYIGTQLGNPNVKSFDAMKEVVGDEVVKAVVGSSGAEGDRDAIKNAFAAASSPAQVQAVVAKFKGLMGSQMNGLQRQYQKSTGMSDFNDFVSEQARSELSGGQPSTAPIGGRVLTYDPASGTFK